MGKTQSYKVVYMKLQWQPQIVEDLICFLTAWEFIVLSANFGIEYVNMFQA